MSALALALLGLAASAGWGAPGAQAAAAAQAGAADPAALTYRLVDTWAKEPWRLTAGRFGRTADISSGPDGTVYILDSRYAVVHVLDRDGRPRSFFPAPPSAMPNDRWTALKLDVGFDGTVHILSRGPYQAAGYYPHRVDRVRPDGRAVDAFDIHPASGAKDAMPLYHDIGVRSDGRIYLSRTGPNNPFIIWPGPTPTPPPPGTEPPDGVDVFGPGGVLQATLATSCMPDSLDVDQDGTIYVVNRCPVPFVNPPPPANPEPEPSGRVRPHGPAQAVEIPRQEGVILYAPDHRFQDFVRFNNPEEVAVGPAGAFVGRGAEIFKLRETAPLYSGPSAGPDASAFFGRVIFRLDVPADGRLLASMNHCYFQGMLSFDDPAARPAPARFAGALDNPELEGPPHPIRLAASADVAVLQGRFNVLGIRPNHEHVVMPYAAEAQTVQRWTRRGAPPDTPPVASRLRSQFGLCSDSETAFTRDVALDGSVAYTVDPDRLQQRPDDALPSWSFWPAAVADIDESPWLAAVSAGGGRVVALDAGRGKVVVVGERGDLIGDWPVAGAANAVPVDLALSGDRVFVADRGRSRVLVRGLDGADRGEWATHDGPTAVAAGPTGDVFVLGRGGWGFRYRPDGALVASWPMPDRSLEALDIAVDADGHVYVSFVKRVPYQRIAGVRRGLPEYTISRAGVWVFAPEALPEPPRITPGACVAAPDKRAQPARIPLGAQVDVRLDVAGQCPGRFDPVQVVIAFDTSRSMTFDDALRRAQATLAEMLGALDTRAVEVGLVTFDAGATLAEPLSRDVAAARARVVGLGGGGDTWMGAGIDLARTELTGPRGNAAARRIILLVSDGVFKDDPADAAARARAAGIEIYGLVFSNYEFNDGYLLNLEQMAGDPDHILIDPSSTDLRAFVEALVRYRPEAGLFETITITDLVPRNMRYVEGSARPPATYDAARHALTWRLANVAAASGVALDYKLLPLECGLWPTNIEATADYRDALGNPGRLVFPIPRVEVVCGTYRAYLPFAVRQACAWPKRPLDVALVMDASSSMREPEPGGARTKLDAAKAAAGAFVDLLDFGADHVAVVAFNRTATRVIDLGGDRERVHTAIGGIATAEGTRIDLGLAAAADAMAAGRRPEALPVVVLLTDGLQNIEKAPNSAVLARADALKAAGVRVFTIGLGDWIDRNLLRLVATTPEGHYFESPSGGDLARIYAAIAERLACAVE